MPIDTSRVNAAVDLLALAERDTRLKRVASTGGGEWAGACPFCGGRDRFHVQPQARRWLCRGCTGGKWQDAIAYVMRRRNCSFREACESLARPSDFRSLPNFGSLPIHSHTPMTVAHFATAIPHTSPPPAFQAQAREIVKTCAAALWTAAGNRAREWLNARGLENDTLKHWGIGYNAVDRHIAGLYVDRGIVIPCEADGTLWYVKVRRPSGEPKYRKLRGSKTGLFGAATFEDRQVAVFTEGEFDALLLWQSARDVAAVGTLGSAGDRIDLAVWARHLLPVPVWLIAYDADEAGARGAAWWTEFSGRTRRVAVPCLRAGDKDITDFRQAGGNLRDWLAFEVARTGQCG